jgi:hypothetical protein
VGGGATSLDVGVRLRHGRGVGVVVVRSAGQDGKNAAGPVYEGVRCSVARCFGGFGRSKHIVPSVPFYELQAQGDELRNCPAFFLATRLIRLLCLAGIRALSSRQS